MNLKLYQLKVFLISALAMAVYETLKELFLPNLNSWLSHLINVMVVSAGFLLAAYFFQKKSQTQLPVTDPPPKINKKQWLASTLFDALDDAVIMTDKDNLIIACNSAFTKITGDSPEEVLGKKPKILLMIRKGCSTLEWTFEFVRFFERSSSLRGLYRAPRLLVISLALGAAFRIAFF